MSDWAATPVSSDQNDWSAAGLSTRTLSPFATAANLFCAVKGTVRSGMDPRQRIADLLASAGQFAAAHRFLSFATRLDDVADDQQRGLCNGLLGDDPR